MPDREKPRGGGPRREWPDRDRPAGRHWKRAGPPGQQRSGPPGQRSGPPGQRPAQGRPRREGERPASDRPRREDRPWQARAPERRWQDRPPQDRPPHDRPAQAGPPNSGPRPARPWQDRPPQDRPPQDRTRRPFNARPYPARPNAGRPFADRPPRREPAVDRDALVGADDELIAGRRPVEEAFSARRDAIRLLIVPERRAALDALAIHATTLRIPVVEVEGGTLTALAGFDGHQGVALVARPRPAGDPDQILSRAGDRREQPFVLVLDSLEDPQNFGTLLRSAEAVGAHGVIYPTRRSAPLSPSAIKASAGATEHLVLAAVEDLAGTLADLHGRGLRIVGADEEAALDYSEADLRGPLAIVVGSEGRGMSGPVRRRLDLTVRIPMRGKIGSLNAAVAGSILLFAAASQRPVPERESTATPTDPQAEGPEVHAEAPEPAPTPPTPDGEVSGGHPEDVPELLPDDR